METTVLVELIGWSIGYASFHNMVARTLDGLRPISHGSTVATGFQPTPTIPNDSYDLDLATRPSWILKIEYESLPTIYFSYGWYGHVKDLCLFSVGDKGNAGVNDGSMETGSAIGDSVEKDLDLAVDIEIDAGKRSVGKRATVSIGASLNYSGQNDGSRKVDFGVSSPIEKVHEDFVGKLANKGAVL
ncbi:hypothetical protein Goklo_006284 [Gossypium klotzschianum]|uniref:Uncharacterized protein n=1 Tax=Gossypium klotzschianum TaxID=34286 RepID=A0A7J8VI02_9ROSI|nr:hypothetical protein [Gossypium klotzschianum]